ncbi:secreted protein [Melampsora americana]|nr:secreted protein [Melampsora americana]
MRSSAILLIAIVALVQSLIAVPATLSERSDELVASSMSMKQIESKIWGLGLSAGLVNQYAWNNGLSGWGRGCGGFGGYGCMPYGYSASCFSYGCGYAGGYGGALGGLNVLCKSLKLKQAELKSQIDHKENENQA